MDSADSTAHTPSVAYCKAPTVLIPAFSTKT